MNIIRVGSVNSHQKAKSTNQAQSIQAALGNIFYNIAGPDLFNEETVIDLRMLVVMNRCRQRSKNTASETSK